MSATNDCSNYILHLYFFQIKKSSEDLLVLDYSIDPARRYKVKTHFTFFLKRHSFFHLSMNFKTLRAETEWKSKKNLTTKVSKKAFFSLFCISLQKKKSYKTKMICMKIIQLYFANAYLVKDSEIKVTVLTKCRYHPQLKMRIGEAEPINVILHPFEKCPNTFMPR